MVYVCFLTNGAKLGLGGSVYAPDEVPEGGRGGSQQATRFVSLQLAVRMLNATTGSPP